MTPTESLTMPTGRKRNRLDRKPAKGHRPGCDCRWCKPEYLQRAPEDILTRSDPVISVRVRPEEREAFAALCERLGESPPRRIRAEILRLIEEDRESQALDRLTNDEAKGEEMMKITRITITTSKDGLGDLPEPIYAETCIEMLQHYFEGAEIDLEVSDRYGSTAIEIEPGEPSDDYEAYMVWVENREQIGRIMQDAFGVACSRF